MDKYSPNNIQLDGDMMYFTIRDSKRTHMQAPKDREALTSSFFVHSLGGAVLNLWAEVGRPFLLLANGKGNEEGKLLPFFLDAKAGALGDRMRLKEELMPRMLERCRLSGWGDLKMQVSVWCQIVT